ncbi:NADH:flavin oxidoreductase/NADH oxidase [Ramlibacter sp.]|uniref:NADH:flavin oxidoreductase/NADH oxidase n=1 Tax=Ramlibacter sp. TaxID=1917967 RepID=UPI002C323E03|nr:NADH:flavin oxidoreductase/NADH oxidase [Ramlibacter sp.]HWI82621.1 NADH:flavin oxidoreductase/NADH oxidase [Ramlibacter sp.]
MTSPALFTPIRFGRLALPNRIMVSPMCQYSAVDGNPVDWHLIHLGSLAISGAGLLCVEATGVTPEGRITPGCLGLYSDQNQAGLQRVVQALRSVSQIPLAIQLSHAGRKASSRAPWDGGALIAPDAGGWLPIAPSALPQRPEEPAPRAMTAEDIGQVIDAFAAAARRARAIGFQAIELHMAHGYLLHQFLSPLANRRDDGYGGALEHRMRLPLEVFEAVAEAAGPGLPVGVRLSATDWVEGGWDIAQTIELARRLEARGCAFVDISSGGVSPLQKIPLGPGYQVHLAAQVKREVGIPVVTVGLITDPAQAEQIVAQGQADVVALARGLLHDPRWPWRAAAELGGTVAAPKQLLRALPGGHPPIFGDVKIGQR